MRGAYAFSTGLRRRAGAPLGWERGFDTLSGVRAALILDYSGEVGGQFFDGTDNTLTFSDIHTFTRASLATQKDSAGLVKFAPHNLIDPSEDWSGGEWSDTNLVVTTNVTVAPDGASTADRIGDGLANGQHWSSNQSYNYLASTTYKMSMWAKDIDGLVLQIGGRSAGFGSNARGNFNLASGTVGVLGSGAIASTIVAYPNGWYLCSLVLKSVSSPSSNQGFYYVLKTADTDNGVTSYQGTEKGIYLWGAQQNLHPMAAANDTFAANYVPTTSAEVHQHRLDHDKDGNRKGLLIEESRTNTFKQANDFDTTWDTISAGAMSPSITGPDGVANSAWKLVDDNSDTGAKSVVVWQNMTSVALSTLHTLSLYMKKGDSINFGMLRVLNFTTPGGTTKAWFDLENGVVGAKDVGFTTSDIEDAGNGWYRCWVTWTTDVADNSGSIYIQPAPSNGNTLVPTDGTSFIHLFGAQFEPGGFPSSYIPTKAVAVTRAAESATVATSGFAFNAGSIGSVITTATKLSPSGSTGYIWQLDDGTNLNRISHYISSGNLTQFSAGGTGSWVDIYGASSITAGVQFKSGFAWADNNGAHTLDGGTVEVDASGTAPSGITTLGLGHNEPSANQYINGHTASLVYYAVDLSDADLVAGTT